MLFFKEKLCFKGHQEVVLIALISTIEIMKRFIRIMTKKK